MPNRAEGGLGRFASGTAPMRRVHDKADQRLIGVGLATAQASELLVYYLHRYPVCREDSL